MLATSRFKYQDPFDAVFKTPTPRCKSYQSGPPLSQTQTEIVPLFSFGSEDFFTEFFEPTYLSDEPILFLTKLRSLP